MKDIIAAYDVLIRNLGPDFVAPLKKSAKQYYTQLLNLLAANKSPEIFSWSKKAFMFDQDISRLNALARYFFNKLARRNQGRVA